MGLDNKCRYRAEQLKRRANGDTRWVAYGASITLGSPQHMDASSLAETGSKRLRQEARDAREAAEGKRIDLLERARPPYNRWRCGTSRIEFDKKRSCTPRAQSAGTS